MNLGDLPQRELARRLAHEALELDFGVVRVRVRSPLAGLAAVVRTVYGRYPVSDPGGFYDITVKVEPRRGLRRFVRPQIDFCLDDERPFEPFPADTHFPMLEWGVNWAVGMRCNQHLLLHAGAVERDGKAVLLPALPGSGKSTLTAALSTRGFRLLSDEFGVVRIADGALLPIPRSIALKNESIAVIRSFAPDAVIGPEFPKTRKGTVAHLAPNAASVAGRHVPAVPALVVFPTFEAGAPTRAEPIPKSRAFAQLSVNSFNYELLGPAGFDAVGAIISRSRCYRLTFGDLDAAIAEIGRLVGEPG